MTAGRLESKRQVVFHQYFLYAQILSPLGKQQEA